MRIRQITIIFAILFAFPSISLTAQEILVPEGYELVDSVIYRPSVAVDSTLVGKNIFAEMPSKLGGDAADVRIHQSQEIVLAMNSYFEHLATRQITGYRVRIFFDNKQTSRMESEETYKKFVDAHHDVMAYRSYKYPFFKVTVGDFRTRSEAMQLLQRIKTEFPSAFIVKETICYPVVDKTKPVIVDTVQFLKPLTDSLSLKFN